MVHFVGAGPGAVDLITVRGRDLIRQADVIVYAGSLVNPALLGEAKPGCQIHDSAAMTLEGVISVMEAASAQNKIVVRLHTGDSSLYGAVREQMDALTARGIPFDVTPGVSAFSAAAAALGAEYTLPGVSQTLILTRMAGRTPVPEAEGIKSLAAHGASMAIYLSAGMLPELARELMAGGYSGDTPVALVYKATWPQERVVRCTLDTLAEAGAGNHIEKTALILVGRFLEEQGERSRLYDPAFSHGYREGSQ